MGKWCERDRGQGKLWHKMFLTSHHHISASDHLSWPQADLNQPLPLFVITIASDGITKEEPKNTKGTTMTKERHDGGGTTVKCRWWRQQRGMSLYKSKRKKIYVVEGALE